MRGEYISGNLFFTFKRLEINWSKTTVYRMCQDFVTVKMYIKVHLRRSLESTGTDSFLRCDKNCINCNVEMRVNDSHKHNKMFN